MRRFYLGKFALALSLAAVSLFALGCPSKNEQSSGDKGGEDKTSRPKVKGKAITAKSYDGTIKGKITWEGGKPDLEKLTADLVKQINTKDDRKHCLAAPPEDRTQQQYRIGKNDGLGNVLVWIEPENRQDWFVVPQEQIAKHKDKRVELHQPYCAFEPHCLVLFPAYKDEGGKTHRTGEILVALNDTNKAKNAKDKGIGHNTKVVGSSSKNPSQGETISPGRSHPFDTIEPDEQVLNISCDIHPWMRGYARSLSHPWGAVTKVGEKEDAEDYGTYEIKGAPVGAKVRVVAWHEELKYLAGPRPKPITVEKETKVNFEAKLKKE
jgi:hypothetical protein